MLDRVDRMILAVLDRAAAASTFSRILGAEKVREDDLAQPYNARRSVVQAGDSEFELWEPASEGPVAQHLERWGEGIFAVGFATSGVNEVARRLEDRGRTFTTHGDQLFLEPDQTTGMRAVIQPTVTRDAIGLITGLYETTNIVDDHQAAADLYTDLFGLDQARFSPIKSKAFGYVGTLTLFDPPTRLDRVEITQTTEPGAMQRYYQKRGQSLYMCFVETPNYAPIRERLEASGGRFAIASDYPDASMFIHPTALCGMLMGVSVTNEAWRWSGRPEMAPKHARA
jgi:catechol 2,3-dioxygenase-like lactoylglutathione lyase family enzyme